MLIGREQKEARRKDIRPWTGRDSGTLVMLPSYFTRFTGRMTQSRSITWHSIYI